MENGVSSNIQSPGSAVRNSSGIFYVLKDLSSYTLSMTKWCKKLKVLSLNSNLSAHILAETFCNLSFISTHFGIQPVYTFCFVSYIFEPCIEAQMHKNATSITSWPMPGRTWCQCWKSGLGMDWCRSRKESFGLQVSPLTHPMSRYILMPKGAISKSQLKFTATKGACVWK